jgi:hypothetical protein
MNIKKAVYRYYGSETEPTSIRVELNDSNIVLGVPLKSANRHYQEIQEWVAKGNKIEEAD